MSGGTISIVPPPTSTYPAEGSSIVGNTCLYGATGGTLFVNGRAGERFAVRNSAAEAVVEGAGKYRGASRNKDVEGAWAMQCVGNS